MEATIYIALTIAFWGASAVLDKLALAGGEPIIGLTIRQTSVVILLISLTVISGKFSSVVGLIRNDTRTALLFIASGVLAGLLGMLTYYAALKLAPVSQVVPFTSTYPLVAALLGVLFLKEAFSPTRALGVLLIILGIYLVQMKTNP